MIFQYLMGKSHENLKTVIMGDIDGGQIDIEAPLVDQFRQRLRSLSETWFFIYAKTAALISFKSLERAIYVTVLIKVVPGINSVHDPIPLGPATTFFLAILLLMSFLGFVDQVTIYLIDQSRIKTDEPNSVAAVMNEFSKDVLVFWGHTYMTAASFVCGSAINLWSYSLWTYMTSSLDIDKAGRVIIYVIYFGLINILSAWVSVHNANKEMPSSPKDIEEN